ncbi:hypothetical protein AAHB54_23505, partial [Bacillus cereus]
CCTSFSIGCWVFLTFGNKPSYVFAFIVKRFRVFVRRFTSIILECVTYIVPCYLLRNYDITLVVSGYYCNSFI